MREGTVHNPLHCSRKRASKVARGRSENLSRSSGWGPAPGQPPARRAPPGRVRGVARRRNGLRPSDLPRKPGGCRRRPESTPTCCARGKPDFPGAQEEERSARLLCHPRAALQPLLGGLRPLRPDHLIPRPVPAPGVPAFSTASLPRPPRGASSRSTYSAGPGVWFFPASRQHGHRPLAPGAASTAGIPDCSPPGSPTTTTQRPSQPRRVIGSTALGLTGGSDGGRGAHGAGLKARSLECGGSQRLGTRPAPRRGPASRPPSYRAPTLAGVTAPPPKERWQRPRPRLRPGQRLCSLESLATPIFVCFRRYPESLGHLKSKTQLEPVEIQAGNAVGVGGGMVDWEGALESLVSYSPKLWGLT